MEREIYHSPLTLRRLQIQVTFAHSFENNHILFVRHPRISVLMTESGGSESPQSHNWRSSPHPPNSPAASSSTNSPSPITELLPETQAGPSKVPKRKLRHKVTSTGVWPCKINGCNKEFAREADLKRHQRTTKTHSMPSLCASCFL